MAYQGAPDGGVAGKTRIPEWWTGSQCSKVSLSQAITLYCYLSAAACFVANYLQLFFFNWMNICYADVISTKHSCCYPIKDIVLGLEEMSCKEAAQSCPPNSFRHIGHVVRRGRYSLKKKYHLIQKMGERNLYGQGLNWTVPFRHNNDPSMS